MSPITSSIQLGESEPLVFAAGLDAIKNIVIDASLVALDSANRRRLKAGTILTKSAAAAPDGKDQLKKYAGTGVIEGILAKDVEFVTGSSDNDTAAGMFYHGCVFRATQIVDYSLYGSAASSALNTCKFETNI